MVEYVNNIFTNTFCDTNRGCVKCTICFTFYSRLVYVLIVSIYFISIVASHHCYIRIFRADIFSRIDVVRVRLRYRANWKFQNTVCIFLIITCIVSAFRYTSETVVLLIKLRVRMLQFLNYQMVSSHLYIVVHLLLY